MELAWGKRWHEEIIRSIALDFHDATLTSECSAWTDSRVENGEERHYVYFATTNREELLPFLAHITHAHHPDGSIEECDLPITAEPVFVRKPDGQLIRLWSPPGPNVPASRTVTIDWATVTYHNRCYTVISEG